MAIHRKTERGIAGQLAVGRFRRLRGTEPDLRDRGAAGFGSECERSHTGEAPEHDFVAIARREDLRGQRCCSERGVDVGHQVVDRQVAVGVRLEHRHGDLRAAVHRDLEWGVVGELSGGGLHVRRAGDRLQVAEGNAVLQRRKLGAVRERDRTLISKINADRESQPAAGRKPDRAVAAQLGDRRQVEQAEIDRQVDLAEIARAGRIAQRQVQRQFIGRGVVFDDVRADDVNQLLRHVLHRDEGRTIVGVEQLAFVVAESGIRGCRSRRHGDRYRCRTIDLEEERGVATEDAVGGSGARPCELEPAMVGRGRALRAEAEAIP